MLEPLDFSRRANLEEEMDGTCPYEDLRHCLRDLAIVNRMTFAHRPVLQWLDELAHTRRGPLKIVDIGCGYGDMLRRIENWAQRHNVPVDLVGVDINANGTRAAREATPPGSAITWLNCDVYDSADAADADMYTVSGVTHHLPEAEIVRLMAWMEKHARTGWFIADLNRKPVPYRIFDITMRGPWWHRFIRPDGLRSIRRSFLAEDWMRICAAAGLSAGDIEIRENRPARLCVSRTKER
jgi:SAM-dependent methyltransferase